MSAAPAMKRRAWLAQLAAAGWPGGALGAGAPAGVPPADVPDPIRRGRPLTFPQDHGAHLGARIEWWYLTGTLWPAGASEAQALARGALRGFQVTFFRLRTGLAAAEALPGRFAARQLFMAHAALTELGAAEPAGGRLGAHLHAQRLQRWSGTEPDPNPAAAPSPARAWALRHEAEVHLGRWWLRREPASGTWRTEVAAPEAAGPGAGVAAGFALHLACQPTQPLLLQGDAGFSRKGPREHEASHYYSLPHLAVSGQLWRGAAAGALPLSAPQAQAVQGRAWLDHEWSDTLLPPESDGWDWLGVSLLGGGALTAFRLRGRGEGAAPVWAGGSWRASAQAPVRNFAPHEVQWEPLAHWQSPRTGGRYPVRWRIRTPVGEYELHALLDAQELDGSAGTGTVYWEGLAELRAVATSGAPGAVLGWGYLEMTGYVGRLRVAG